MLLSDVQHVVNFPLAQQSLSLVSCFLKHGLLDIDGVDLASWSLSFAGFVLPSFYWFVLVTVVCIICS